MATINISSEEGEFTNISNNFIEYYMADANGDFVKLYLYLAMLCSAKKQISISVIADHLNCTEKDICRGIKYWIKADAVSLKYSETGEVTGIVLLNLKRPEEDIASDLRIIDFSLALASPANKAEEKSKATDKNINASESDSDTSVETPEPTTESAVNKVPRKKQPTAEELDNFLSDSELANLISEATAYCNHELSQKELNSLIYIKDQLKFSFDLTEYLLEYCASVRKTSFNYIEQVAKNWFSMGISTREEAQEYTVRYITLYGKILKALGITNRSTPVPLEKSFIDKWIDEFGFSEVMIIEACNRAISRRPNDATFPYVNGILENWHKNNVSSLADIAKQDAEHAKNKKTSSQKSNNDQIISEGRNTSDKLKQLEAYYLNGGKNP